MSRTLDIILQVLGADAAKNAILGVGSAAQKTSAQVTQSGKGMASAWNPYISACQKAAAEEKKKLEAAIQTANGTKKAVIDAAAAVKAASKDERDAANQRLADARKAAVDAQSNLNRLSQSYKQLQGAANQAGRSASSSVQGIGNSATQAVGKVSALEAKLKNLNDAVKSTRFENLENVSSQLGGMSFRTSAAAAAGGAVVANGVMAADEQERLRKSLAFSIGSEAGADAAIGWLREFDRSSPFDLKETAAGFNNLLGKGFGEREAKNLLTSLGDVTARTQGGTDQLMASIRQLGQIRTGGRASMQDINALSEGGGLPITKILESQLGSERMKGVMSGAEPLSADEFFGAFMKGVEKYKGGMAEANTSLQGQLSNLNSAFYQLSGTLGKSLLPTVTAIVQVFTKVTDFFNSLPAPLQAVISWGTGIGVVLMGVVGIGLAMAKFVIDTAIGINTLSLLAQKLKVDAAAAAVTSGGATAVAAGGATTVAAGAATGAAAGGVAGFLSKAAKIAGPVMIGATIGAGVYDAVRGDRPSSGQIASYYWNRLKGNSDEDAAAIAQGLPTAAERKKQQDQMAAQKAALTPVAIPTAATSPSIIPVSGGGFAGGAIPFNGPAGHTPFTADIRSMQDQLSQLKGKENKDKRAVLQSQIRAAQRAQSDWRAQHAAEIKEQRKAEAEAKKVEKAALKKSKLDNRSGASLDKYDIEDKYSVQIEDLQEQLEQAQESKDKAQVASLTTRIALLEAAQRREEALVDAALIEDEGARSAAIIGADKQFGVDSRKAQRLGRRAGNRIKEKGGGLENLASFFSGGSNSILNGAFNPLNPAGTALGQVGGGMSWVSAFGTPALSPAGTTDPTIRARLKGSQDGQGKFKVRLELVENEVDLGRMGLGGVM